VSTFGTITGLKTIPFPSSDPRFPKWRFVTTGAIVGTATGGIAQIFFVIRPTGQPPSGLVYGLRTISAIGPVGAGVVAAQAQRFVLIESQGGVDEVLNFPLTTVAFTANEEFSSALRVDTIIGQSQRGAANSQVQVHYNTNVDGGGYEAYLEGFVWESRALYEGGPLFPGEFPTP